MPAAAVIPAPIAYIKVVAVKKLVVGFLGLGVVRRKVYTATGAHPLEDGACSLPSASWTRDFYFEKIRVFKAGLRLNTSAWNNGIGLWSYFVGF